MTVLSGLDVLLSSKSHSRKITGNIAYLCHSASVDRQLVLGASGLKKLFGKRLVKLFGPQHGIFADVQANMVETEDTIHPYFKLPVYSLYSERRIPSAESLEGIQNLVIDLQDVGTRIYTYIWTLSLVMEACQGKDIKIVILDRPNPVNGVRVEGNMLDQKFDSFMGRYPLAMRHGLTIGEIAHYFAKFHSLSNCDLQVIKMKGWKRTMYYEDTRLPWVMPSPNIPTNQSAVCFIGSVNFEGTNISEGRGTTRPFELIGHPKLEPFGFLAVLEKVFRRAGLSGFTLRPCYFVPTFDKHQGQSCGGYQFHITNYNKFKPWHVFHVFMRELKRELGDEFKWRPPPYEYEHEKMPIDILAGTDKVREWVDSLGSLNDLMQIEKTGLKEFVKQREEVLLY